MTIDEIIQLHINGKADEHFEQERQKQIKKQQRNKFFKGLMYAGFILLLPIIFIFTLTIELTRRIK